MNSGAPGHARILHIHTRFPDSPSAARSIAVARGLGSRFEHHLTVVEGGGSGPAVAPFRQVSQSPAISGFPTLGHLQRIAKFMLAYDLVCTYDYGAIHAAMAHTAFSRAFALPPLVHHESADARRGWKADWYRRIALGNSAGLVVPDERIEEAALEAWQQPIGRVKDIPLGIDLGPWRKAPPPDLLPRLLKRPGEMWIGLVTDFSCSEALQALLGEFANFSENWHLVAFGDFEQSRPFRDCAAKLEIAHRVHVPGALASDGEAIGLLDLAVFPADAGASEPDAIRAMAAGMPILADRSSLAAPLLPEENREFVIDFRDGEEVAFALGTLAADHGLRERLAMANRARARERHNERDMIAAHRRLYSSAIGLRES